MGYSLVDKYTYLHFATGIIAYYWGVNFLLFTVIHALFEILENTKTGIHFIDTYITIWPGGKDFADAPINRIGDTIVGMIGWISSYILWKYT